MASSSVPIWLAKSPAARPLLTRHGAPIEDIRSAYKNVPLRAHAEDMIALALEKGIEFSVEEALQRVPHRLGFLWAGFN